MGSNHVSPDWGSHQPFWRARVCDHGLRRAGWAMINAAKGWSLSVIAFVLVSILFVLAWSYAIHSEHPVEFGSAQVIIPPVVRSGQMVNICREMEFMYQTDLHISRSWSSTRLDGSTLTVDGGMINVSRDKGYMYQCRSTQLPVLTPGIWTMRTFISYRTWPFWESTYEAPKVSVKVIE